MTRTQPSPKDRHDDIEREIAKLRSQNKIMWRELIDAPNIQFIVKTEKHKHQLDLNAKFLKNEARLKRLHNKIGREWVPTPELPNRAFKAALLTMYIAVFSVITIVIIQSFLAFY